MRTVKRIDELLNQLPGDPVKRRESPVLALTQDSFRGRDGIGLQLKAAAIYTFRGEKICRIQAFFDRGAALSEFDRSAAM